MKQLFRLSLIENLGDATAFRQCGCHLRSRQLFGESFKVDLEVMLLLASMPPYSNQVKLCWVRRVEG